MKVVCKSGYDQKNISNSSLEYQVPLIGRKIESDNEITRVINDLVVEVPREV